VSTEGIMGKLLYGDSEIEIEFDDRALTHIQIVIGAKLRRGESFFFSWKDDLSVGAGRSSVWLDKSIPLYFKFSANSGQGLVFTTEPGGLTPAPKSRV
jgi:hypothetical protein